MLTIRRDQVDRWFEGRPELFEDLLLAKVRSRHPIMRQTDDMLRGSIRAGIARARRNALRSDRDISAFVLIMFEVTPNFDQQPDLRRALDDPSRPVEARWERLSTSEFDAAWREADRPDFYDPEAWGDPPAPAVPEPSPNLDDWAEAIASIRAARELPEGAVPAEPTNTEVEETARGLRARLAARRT